MKSRRVRDGAAGFLVLHLNCGALVIEVKGGLIAYHAEAGVWTSTCRAEEEQALTGDTVDQGTRSASPTASSAANRRRISGRS